MEDSLSPEELVAAQFMAHKGYPGIEPYDIEEVEPRRPDDEVTCWYFLYELPEGVLELEVYWNGTEWETTVSTFTANQAKG